MSQDAGLVHSCKNAWQRMKFKITLNPNQKFVFLNSLKKLSAILLLSLFIISCNVEWISILINRVQMRQEIAATMARDLNDDKLETFSFTASEFEALDYSTSDREITIDGKNYDVAAIKHINGKITVRCLADEKEMQIKLWAKKNQGQKNQLVEKSFSKIFIVQNPTVLLQVVNPLKKAKLFCYNSAGLTNVYLDIIIPPPSLV
jgi:hypothetical protein